VVIALLFGLSWGPRGDAVAAPSSAVP